MPAIQEQIKSSHGIPLEKHLIKGPKEKSLWENSFKIALLAEVCTPAMGRPGGRWGTFRYS